MECALFALTGVVLGTVLTLFAKGEIRICKKSKGVGAAIQSEADEHSEAKSEQQLMRQWQNLLRYGAEGETEPY